MKRLAIFCLPLVLVISSLTFAQVLAPVTVTITVNHAKGKPTSYTQTSDSVGEACGKAFLSATVKPDGTSNLISGDEVQIPAVDACYIWGNSSENHVDWPANIKFVGKGPTATILNVVDDISVSGNDQTFQDLKMEFSPKCCTDTSAIGAQPTTGIFTLKNVDITTRIICEGAAGLWLGSGKAVLDHVNLSSSINALNTGENSQVTIRDSTISTFCDNVLEGSGTIDIYDSVITNSKDSDDATLYPTGTINVYGKSSIVAAPESRAVYCNAPKAVVNLYPGVKINGRFEKQNGCSVNFVPAKK